MDKISLRTRSQTRGTEMTESEEEPRGQIADLRSELDVTGGER